MAHLLFADGAVLVAAVAHDVLVGAGISAQTGLARAIEQGEGRNGGAPGQNAQAPGDDAIEVAGANGPLEPARAGQAHDGEGGDEVGGGDGEEDEGGGEVGPGGPCHGQLALAEVEVGVAAEDFEGVDEEDDDGAAQDHDEQAQGGAQATEPMDMPAVGDVGRHWQAGDEAGGWRLGLVVKMVGVFWDGGEGRAGRGCGGERRRGARDLRGRAGVDGGVVGRGGGGDARTAGSRHILADGREEAVVGVSQQWAGWFGVGGRDGSPSAGRGEAVWRWGSATGD